VNPATYDPATGAAAAERILAARYVGGHQDAVPAEARPLVASRRAACVPP
jgi:hypothetical protein